MLIFKSKTRIFLRFPFSGNIYIMYIFISYSCAAYIAELNQFVIISYFVQCNAFFIVLSEVLFPTQFNPGDVVLLGLACIH